MMNTHYFHNQKVLSSGIRSLASSPSRLCPQVRALTLCPQVRALMGRIAAEETVGRVLNSLVHFRQKGEKGYFTNIPAETLVF